MSAIKVILMVSSVNSQGVRNTPPSLFKVASVPASAESDVITWG